MSGLCEISSPFLDAVFYERKVRLTENLISGAAVRRCSAK